MIFLKSMIHENYRINILLSGTLCRYLMPKFWRKRSESTTPAAQINLMIKSNTPLTFSK